MELLTLEFKSQLPGGSDGDKKKFLASVSSFANTVGGDLVFGVVDEKGVATSVEGVIIPDGNLDALKLRFEDQIRRGIEPRIPPIIFKRIDGFPAGSVVVIRVPRSWAAPHMVCFDTWNRFYARANAGKYILDVFEIKSAVISGEGLPRQIQNFRIERIAKIAAGETPVPLTKPRVVVLHLLPFSAFGGGRHLSVDEMQQVSFEAALLGNGEEVKRNNLDGFLFARREGARHSGYCQVFRSGAIEIVGAEMPVPEDRNGIPKIASAVFEQQIMQATENYLIALREFEAGFPCYVMLSMIGFSGCEMATPRGFLRPWPTPIDRDQLLLPEVAVFEFREKMDHAMRPLIDMVWNASGYDGSDNFDENGKWLLRRVES